MSIFRQYTFDDSFLQVFVSSTISREYQLTLVFAKDYDESGNPTNGKFSIFWDQTKVTPAAISQFRKLNPGVIIKVYVSIGDRDSQHPFKPLDINTWIENATSSLTSIIQNCQLGVEGLDVFYQHIETDTCVFVECIGQLIRKLKASKVISLASISPSAALNKEYYFPLYFSISQCVDWVDYQFQNELTPVPSPNNLLNRYNVLAFGFYPIRKLFAGYSAENEDWDKLSPIVFFLGGSQLLQRRRTAGISIYYHNFGNSGPQEEEQESES